jgi:hypothetical protein
MGSFTNSGGTFISDGTLGGITVLNPTNAGTSDDSYATCALLLGQISNYLMVTGFNFAIPTDAIITGITVKVERNATSTSAITDNSVKLVKAGVISGNDKASGSTWTTSDVVATYGSASDTWGLSWTPADINSSNFGCVVSAIASLAATVNIDYISITINYTGSNRSGGLLGTQQIKVGDGMSRSDT